MARKSPEDPRLDTSTLSERQKRILQVIRDAVILRGYPPSIREIGDATGLQSTSSVAYQLKELERKGFLRRDPNKPRAVDVRTITEDDQPKTGPKPKKPTHQRMEAENTDSTAFVPLLGAIAAGAPILAEENVDTFFPLPAEFVGKGEVFMLTVVGESMKDAGILHGDHVVVRAQKTAEQGDFVAALLDGEATVKEFRKDKAGVWLIPHNAEMDPLPGNDAEIMGKVVMVMRKV